MSANYGGTHANFAPVGCRVVAIYSPNARIAGVIAAALSRHD
jgi:hypothetical protein